MTERASDLLSELSVRLTADLQEAGATASEAIRTSMPELVLTVPESFSEMPIRSSSQFLEALYRTLRIDSSVPWAEYYVLAREASLRYAEKGAALVREGSRLKLAKTLGLEPGQESEFSVSGRPGPLKVMEIATGPAESRVDRIAGEWSAIRAELRTKGVLLGAMTVATRLPRTFESSDLEFVAAVAEQIAVALDRARQHTKEARTEHLTGLANRPECERAIDRAVASAERHKRRLALMMIDLDNLKDINDTYRHHVGDDAIRVLAAELQRAVRATDTCGRLGGDEFGVAMPDADERDAREVGLR